MFSLDASGSIGKDNFQKQVDFVKDVVYGLNLDQDTRVGLLTYSTSPNIRFYLNEYKTRMDVLNALAVYYSGGTTNTASQYLVTIKPQIAFAFCYLLNINRGTSPFSICVAKYHYIFIND